MQRAILFCLPLMTFAASASVAVQAQEPDTVQAGALSVTVSGLHSTQGQLIACLWTEKKGFPSCQKSPTARRLLLPVKATTMQLSFPGVAPGTYAVTVHHDEDSNGKMKHNFIGMPKEGVGVSNNPGGMPGYSKSLIEVSGDSAIAIRMRYLFD